MSDTKRAPRAYVGAFTLSLGLLNVTGKLFPVVISNRTRVNAFKRVCPDREVPVPVAQRYIATDEADTDNPTIYAPAELRMAKELDDGTLAFVDEAEIEAARTSDLPLNVAEVSVHPARDVDGRIWSDPNGGAYVFQPTTTNEHYAALVEAVGSDEHVFLGVANIRNTESFFRLRAWNGHLVVEKILWPEEVNEYEPVEVTTNSKLAAAITEMVRGLEEDFDPESYTSTTREKLTALTASLTGDEKPTVGTPKPKVEESGGLLAAIEAFNAK